MPTQLPTEGVYRGFVKDWKLTQAGKNNDGNFQFRLTVRVEEKAIDDDNPKAGFVDLEQPFTRTVFMTITPNTLGRVVDELKFIGFTSDNILNLDPENGPDPHDFSGTEVPLYCKHDEYNGKVTDKWNISRRKEVKPITGDKAEQLVALFGDKFKELMSDKTYPDEVGAGSAA